MSAGPGAVTKLTLAYDGTRFAGWARQPGLPSVQEEVERALSAILGERLPVTVAGRTDRGVHAWGQVASYPHEAVDPRRLNAVLPDDVAVLSAEPAAPGFDARRDARSRTYCYRVRASAIRDPFERGRALWWPRPLERDRLHACARALAGSPDFTAFTPAVTEHVRFRRRVLEARWLERGPLLEFWIQADSFLRHMNRVLVGTMLEAAAGRRTVESFAQLLEGAPRERAGPTAPAHALYLASVSYAQPA